MLSDNTLNALIELLNGATYSQMTLIMDQLMVEISDRDVRGELEDVFYNAGCCALTRGASARDLALKAHDVERNCYRAAIWTVIEDMADYLRDNEGRVRDDMFTQYLEETAGCSEWTSKSPFMGITMAVSHNSEQHAVHFGPASQNESYSPQAAMVQDVRDELNGFPDERGIHREGDWWVLDDSNNEENE